MPSDFAPHSTIKIYKDIPLDTTYDHTLYFADESAQQAFFDREGNANEIKFLKYTFSNQMYQRVGRGKLRIQKCADALYDCNYLSFRNIYTEQQSGNVSYPYGKTFYAFITSVEYVNNKVTEITYEIDPMQTWLAGVHYTFGQCFVEREHAASDTVGDNLIDEGLELGEMEYSSCTYANPNATNKIVVAATFDKQYNEVTGDKYGGVYSGVKLNYFDTPAQVNNFINGAGAKINGIVCIFYAPSNIVTNANTEMIQSTFNITKNISGTFGSYTPKNKKLYTYPYNYLYVTNFQSKTAIYKYELFSANQNLTFLLCGAFDCNPVMVLAPQDYNTKLASGTHEYNFTEMLTLSGWPQCAFNVDIYKSWLAQSKAALPYQIASNVVSAAGGVAQSSMKMGMDADFTDALFSGAVSAMTSSASTVLGYLGQKASMQELGKQPRGNSSGNTMFALNKIDFGFYNVRLREQYARIIDEYFTMYGYACHRVKVPNIHARTRWTYTKTVGCKIIGSMPCDMEDKICKIFDHGITFWTDGDEVGNYNLANGIAF